MQREAKLLLLTAILAVFAVKNTTADREGGGGSDRDGPDLSFAHNCLERIVEIHNYTELFMGHEHATETETEARGRKMQAHSEIRRILEHPSTWQRGGRPIYGTMSRPDREDELEWSTIVGRHYWTFDNSNTTHGLKQLVIVCVKMLEEQNLFPASVQVAVQTLEQELNAGILASLDGYLRMMRHYKNMFMKVVDQLRAAGVNSTRGQDADAITAPFVEFYHNLLSVEIPSFIDQHEPALSSVLPLIETRLDTLYPEIRELDVEIGLVVDKIQGMAKEREDDGMEQQREPERVEL